MALGADADEYEIPQSRGIPPVVSYLFVIGVVIIVFMGVITVVQAGENHVWPASSTPTIDLSGKL
jgi:hypothetical protein